MHYLWTAIVGLIAGGLGKLLLPGKDPGGIIVTMLIGIGGSFLGDYVSGLLGITLFDGLIGAVLGAIVILLGWRFVSTKMLNKTS
ncbi:MAG: GlsB/YeaQ/YmgE family stress response membrane protein [Chitinophagales bacterium]|nr:GlsB/YeaQ/YmgE family stress response membrane protein [Chitinophagales bacterium]